MTEKTLVLFRAEGGGPFKNNVTAVFPYEPHSNAYDMTCYQHIGQHGGCNMVWYRTTRAARPDEYADLKRELENYGPPDAHYVLEVRQRMPPDALKRRRAVLAEMNRAAIIEGATASEAAQ